MKNLKLSEALFNIVKTGSICINEKNGQNVDFLIVEFAKKFTNLHIISYYNTKQHYEKFLALHNVNCSIETIFETEKFNYSHDLILIDDYYTFEKHNCIDVTEKSFIYVFRCDTFKERDQYLGNTIIECRSLESGISAYLDGCVKIYDREATQYIAKYKIKNKSICYED